MGEGALRDGGLNWRTMSDSKVNWYKVIKNLDRAEQRREATQRKIREAYREIQQDLDYYYAAFQSPCRNCAGWIQELQGMQVEAFERAIIGS